MNRSPYLIKHDRSKLKNIELVSQWICSVLPVRHYNTQQNQYTQLT